MGIATTFADMLNPTRVWQRAVDERDARLAQAHLRIRELETEVRVLRELCPKGVA